MGAGEGRGFFGASCVKTNIGITGDEDSFLFPGIRTVSFDAAGSSVVNCDSVREKCTVVPDVRPSYFVRTCGCNHIRLLCGTVLSAIGFGLVRGGVITPWGCLQVVFVVAGSSCKLENTGTLWHGLTGVVRGLLPVPALGWPWCRLGLVGKSLTPGMCGLVE